MPAAAMAATLDPVSRWKPRADPPLIITYVVLVLALLWIGRWLAFSILTSLAMDFCSDAACRDRVKVRVWLLVGAQLANAGVVIAGHKRWAILLVCGFAMPPLLSLLIAPG